ncbi:hypothetical protein GWI33_012493, partial [Rhynchophorus ferrugineus]
MEKSIVPIEILQYCNALELPKQDRLYPAGQFDTAGLWGKNS